jgi:hypothetical protein
MSSSAAQIHFEQTDSNLTAVEITRDGRRPLIASLHRALFALGIVVSSYQVRSTPTRLIERLVIERADGGAVEGPLNASTKAAILPLALG